MENLFRSPANPERDLDAEKHAASKVTIIGMLLDAILGLLKVVAGTLFHSHALVVDGIHSFTDVVSDWVVLAVMRLSRKGPDDDHPYGHQRIETLGTLLLGSILIAVGAALAWENILRLFEGEELVIPAWPVLIAAAISVLSKEWIFRYTRRVGIKIRSDLIVANAWHSRTDAISSVVVLLSTAGAMLGVVWLDTAAAVAVAIIIVHTGWKFTWDSVKELIDTGLSQEDTEKLRAIALSTPGVRNVHELRSRRMGQDILLDVDLVVRPEISVSEGHQIGLKVVAGMREALDNIQDITFHIDAENDEDTPALNEPGLPSREEIHTEIAESLGELPPQSRLGLHYLEKRVHLEIFLDEDYPAPEITSQRVREALANPPWLGSVRIWVAA
ncbi:cation diffusion facilitator family transporter [Marinobacter sp. S0848L]|uniref:cation diffusion facilitator family transporter n=1 Tax=Marinobacter sp. S0848L TaxID=2926423 RepID=UPI001FF61D95|nr:cation diffusion facilitator family transporter [Marinobacter sp. S0848L]MCK0106343.1 cation diffusion facilitator family transporter [Marinobacter sp. S0848L]